MEHLNYCRQMTKQFREFAGIPSLPPEMRERMLNCMTLAAASEKFILPPSGYLIDDKELRALDESERLRLPFTVIALEFQCAPDADVARSSTKRIVLAVELDDGVLFRSVVWADAMGIFNALPAFMLEHGNYLQRDRLVDGFPCVRLQPLTGPGQELLGDSEIEDCGYEARVLLGFINALTCSNVHTERSEPKNAGKKIKAALPFDAYHLLTIDVPSKADKGAPTGGHRSPREHLRRGHIRRLADSRRIWVNAAVIGSGRGAGVITKDYAVRHSA